MTDAELRQLLEQVRSGQLAVDDDRSRMVGVGALGYAHVDLERRERCGFPEVIFCAGKTGEWVEGVVRQLVAAGQDCLATRVSDEQAAALAAQFPQGAQDRVARTFWLPSNPPAVGQGRVVVITAGT